MLCCCRNWLSYVSCRCGLCASTCVDIILAFLRLELVEVVACRTALMAVLFEGVQLQRIKTFFEESWKVKHVVHLGGCIVCSPTKTVGRIWVTEEGKVEYMRSGVCEACFDSHGQSSAHLTNMGAYLLMMWQVVSKASHGVNAAPPHGSLFSSISERSYAWPLVYKSV